MQALAALRHARRRLKTMGNPWRHVFEHSLWTILVALVMAAINLAFFANLLPLQGSWDWLSAPVSGSLILGMDVTWLLVPGLVDVRPGPVGGAIWMAAVLLAGPWVWLAAPLVFTVGLVEAIRRCFRNAPREGLTFPQAVPAYVVAIAISEMGMAVAAASFGLWRARFGMEAGIEFARASLPVAIAPLALMILRRVIAAVWRRRFPRGEAAAGCSHAVKPAAPTESDIPSATRSPWHYVLEHSIWSAALALVILADSLLRAPLAWYIVWTILGALVAVLLPDLGYGVTPGTVFALILGTWAWLSLPLLLVVGFMQLIRWCQHKRAGGPSLGLTFQQILPACAVAIVASEMGMSVALALTGVLRPYGGEAGIDFPLAIFPIPILPVVLMALRRAMPAWWRRFKIRQA